MNPIEQNYKASLQAEALGNLTLVVRYWFFDSEEHTKAALNAAVMGINEAVTISAGEYAAHYLYEYARCYHRSDTLATAALRLVDWKSLGQVFVSIAQAKHELGKLLAIEP